MKNTTKNATENVWQAMHKVPMQFLASPAKDSHLEGDVSLERGGDLHAKHRVTLKEASLISRMGSLLLVACGGGSTSGSNAKGLPPELPAESILAAAAKH